MQKRKLPINEILSFALGELIVSILTVLGFLLLDAAGVLEFSGRVILGAALGCIVIVINYTALNVSVNNAMNRFIALRGDAEMSEEEAELFAKKNSAQMQNTIKTSFILRTASMMIALVVAFLTGWFSPLATAIPMFAFRPLLTVIELVQSRLNSKKPDPSKFIRYDFDDDNNEEESD